MISQSRRVLGAAALAVLTALAAPVAADEPVARYHAFAVNMSNVGPQGGVPVDITIERWTTEEERAQLRTVLAEKGDEALLDALRGLKRAGSIRASSGGLGWDIQYARREESSDGGSRVVIATDRPMSFYERTNQPVTAEYEYLVAEFRVRADGKGQGTLVPMAKVTYDKNDRTIEIENYASEPVRLNEVREIRPKADKDKASAPEKK